MILRGHTDIVHDLRFIPESDILLSVSSDKDMRAWRLNDYTCAAIYRYVFLLIMDNIKLSLSLKCNLFQWSQLSYMVHGS